MLKFENSRCFDGLIKYSDNLVTRYKVERVGLWVREGEVKWFEWA